MKRYSLAFFLTLLTAATSFSQFRLDITITELRNNNGKVMLQLLDENETVIKEVIGPINDKSCQIVITDLKPGKYAIRYYHDENQNGKMETNMIGKPTEGYGFSNNVTGKFGPPSFEKWLFDIRADKTVSLKPVY